MAHIIRFTVLGMQSIAPPNLMSAPGMHGWCTSSECTVPRVRNKEWVPCT